MHHSNFTELLAAFHAIQRHFLLELLPTPNSTAPGISCRQAANSSNSSDANKQKIIANAIGGSWPLSGLQSSIQIPGACEQRESAPVIAGCNNPVKKADRGLLVRFIRLPASIATAFARPPNSSAGASASTKSAIARLRKPGPLHSQFASFSRELINCTNCI